jgi:crotonobetainyl-CoA:carnitine CoA-transferase CaiB-like acyl-CoA transferase
LVADLSSLWAGPLCGQLLARAGAVVVKVESPARPDGTRRGAPAFFDWMHAGKLSYALHLDADQHRLRNLLAVADVVIEGSRPAALRRRRLSVDEVPARPGRVWLRISGHLGEPNRPAFGDDAAVAGGLVGTSPGGLPVFCGDAIADPLSGLEAARAVARSLLDGGGEVIDVSMAAVAARYAGVPRTINGVAPVVPPRAPSPCPSAAPLGADNAAVHRVVCERLAGAC